MMLTIIALVFGLVLLIVGAVGLGSINSLDVDKNSTAFKNAKNTNTLVLIIGIVMFVAGGFSLYTQRAALKGKLGGMLGNKMHDMKMKRYYF